MAGGPQGTFQVPEDMRKMAEQSVTQTRQALERYLQAVRRTSETMEQGSDKARAGTKDMAQKTFSAMEQNLRASLDYAERLVRARNLQEAAQIQSEFARAQTEAMQAQMKEYGSVVQSAVDTARSMAESAGEAMKGAAQSVAEAATHAKDRVADAVTSTKGKGTQK